MMKILSVSANYPDEYHLWAPWNKRANLAISKLANVEIEVVSPRPYSLPFKFFPYHNMCKIPLREKEEEGMVHYPRFFYLVPKRFFYGITGNFYRSSVSKYVFQNITKPDLVHSHHVYPDGYGMISICKKWGIPLVVDIHGDSLFTRWLNHRILNKKVMKTLNFSGKIICISKNIYSLSRKIGLDEEKLEYIPLGVDIDKFKPRSKDKIREEFSVKENHIILFVGNLNSKKGVYYLLEAFSHVLSKINQKNFVRLVIVGDGPDKKGLLHKSQMLGIKNSITFTGILTGETLWKWYSLSDIFILPSLTEGKPTVINEAMASECAIIATQVGGIPEQVRDGYNGFLVEPKNPDILAKKIIYLLDNENEIIRMGKNSRKRIIEKGWTWEGYAEKVIRVYKDVLYKGD